MRIGDPCVLRIASENFRVDDGTLNYSQEQGKVTVEPLPAKTVFHFKYELGLSLRTASGSGERYFLIDEARGHVVSEALKGKTMALKVYAQIHRMDVAKGRVDIELGCSLLRVDAVKSNPG
jgi:hypothetical protein